MLALIVIIVFAFMPAMLYGRISAATSGTVPGWYFRTLNPINKKTGKAVTIPENITQFSRQMSNLFEMPVLFYAVCSLAVAAKVDSELLGVLAWAYVAARLVHMVIHTTSNSVLPRLGAFVVSTVVLGAMIVIVGLRVLETYELPSTEGVSWSW